MEKLSDSVDQILTHNVPEVAHLLASGLSRFPDKTLEHELQATIGGIEYRTVTENYDTKWIDSVGAMPMPVPTGHPQISAINLIGLPIAIDTMARFFAYRSFRIKAVVQSCLCCGIPPLEHTGSAEVLEECKDRVDYLYDNYRMVLQISGREKLYFLPIRNRPYTKQDVYERVEEIVRAANLGVSTEMPDGAATKLNELVTAIKTEEYWRNFNDPTYKYSVANIWNEYTQRYFDGENGMLVFDMARSNVVPTTALTYNDRKFFYNGFLDLRHSLYKYLNFNALHAEPVVGNIRLSGGQFEVCTDASGVWELVEKVADVYNIAHTWSQLDYNGCMQVLDNILKMMSEKNLRGNPWYSVLDVPIKTSLLNFIATVEQIKSVTLDALPILVDLSKKVSMHRVDSCESLFE